MSTDFLGPILGPPTKPFKTLYSDVTWNDLLAFLRRPDPVVMIHPDDAPALSEAAEAAGMKIHIRTNRYLPRDRAYLVSVVEGNADHPMIEGPGW